MEIKAEMQITNKGTLFAIGTVTLDGVFQIPGVKVLILHDEEGNARKMIALPKKKMADGSYQDVIHIKDPQIWADIKTEVYNKVKEAVDDWIHLKDVEVDMHFCRPGGHVNAYATIHYKEIDISGIQIIEEGNQVRVLFPYDIVNGKMQSIIAPFGAEMRESFYNTILSAYKKQKDFKPEKERGKSL